MKKQNTKNTKKQGKTNKPAPKNDAKTSYKIENAWVVVNAPKPTIDPMTYSSCVTTIDSHKKLVTVNPIKRTYVKNRRMFCSQHVCCYDRKDRCGYMAYLKLDPRTVGNETFDILSEIQDLIEAVEQDFISKNQNL